MPDNESVFIIVPAYNEASVIEDTLGPLVGSGHSIVVVDDGSSDATWQKASRFPVHLLRHPVNLGQGAALQTGVSYALGKAARFIVHFDADGQHDPGAISRLLEPVRSHRAQVALGSRFLEQSSAAGIPRGRRALLRTAAFMTRTFTGMKITDTHNGLRAFAAEAASRLTLRENRMAHASEILGEIRRLGLTYEEVPVRIRYSEYSQRKGQSVFNALNILIDVCLRRIFQ